MTLSRGTLQVNTIVTLYLKFKSPLSLSSDIAQFG